MICTISRSPNWYEDFTSDPPVALVGTVSRSISGCANASVALIDTHAPASIANTHAALLHRRGLRGRLLEFVGAGKAVRIAETHERGVVTPRHS